MQFEVKLTALDSAILPFHYFHQQSVALLNALTRHQPKMAAELHDGVHRSKLKLFVFSPLNSQPQPQTVPGGMRLGEKVYFRLAGCWPELLYAFGEALLAYRDMEIAGKKFRVREVNMVPMPELAPTTLWRPFGQSGTIVTAWNDPVTHKKRCQLPDNSETDLPACEKLLADNLRHKLSRLNGIRPDIVENLLSISGYTPADIPDIPIKIQFLPLAKDRPFRTALMKIKDVNVRSWRCPVQVTAPEVIQRLVFDAGLGNQNAQGFGLMQKGREDICC